MLYFDSAATTAPKPLAVREAVCKAMEHFGNPSRGAHGAALAAGRTLEEARGALAAHFGSPTPERLAFTKNATEALNLAIGSIEGHIVSTRAEHNAVLRPLHHRGNYSLADLDEHGRVTTDALRRQLRPETTAVVVAHASNLTGNVAPMEDIAALCREKGLLLIVDAAQTAGLLPLDVAALHCAALCFTGHKGLYGPQGTGGVVLGPHFTPRPLMVGGSGSHSLSLDQPPDLPTLLEAGTQNSHGVAGLLAGLHYVQGTPEVFSKADALARTFYEALKGRPGIAFYGDYEASLRVPIVSLNLAGHDAADIADRLDQEYDIAVRPGLHCAPLLHRHFGTRRQGALRFSFSHQNTPGEMDTAVRALLAIQ